MTKLLLIFLALIMTSCATSNSNNKNNRTASHSVVINADGNGVGKDIYTLISQVFGRRSIESPDLYSSDHTTVEHLYEDYDAEIGHHWVMTSHRDLDGNKGHFKGRQRNEFKIYGGSNDNLKGFENTTFEYHWKMKINEAMEVSRHFTHFFQLKPKGGDDGTPTLTITGAQRKGVDVVEIRYQVPTVKKQVLATIDWDKMRGQWLQIYVKATFSNHGSLVFAIQPLNSDTPLALLNIKDIDLWIGENKKHYQRPKWGIVRSLKDKGNLRANEEIVRFADLHINRF